MANPNMNNTKEAAQHGREIARGLKEDLRESTGKAISRAQEAAPELKERIRGAFDDARAALSTAAEGGKVYVSKGEDFIKKYPLATVAGAAVTGMLLSRLFFRGSSED